MTLVVQLFPPGSKIYIFFTITIWSHDPLTIRKKVSFRLRSFRPYAESQSLTNQILGKMLDGQTTCPDHVRYMQLTCFDYNNYQVLTSNKRMLYCWKIKHILLWHMPN